MDVISVNAKLPFNESQVNWKPITNADRIRAMTGEELAEWIISITEDPTTDWLDWLKEEAQCTPE